jgi:energy-coupling factor transporter ATP-binding protein EcfA2
MLERLQQRLSYRAAIVGPHGSGKSTLLEHLGPLLGEETIRLRLRRSERPFAKIQASVPQWTTGGMLVLDGFEQLSLWQAIRVCWMTRRRQVGLLVTCHRPSWLLPTLVRTAPTPELVQRLVSERLADAHQLSPTARCRLTEPRLLQRWLTEERGSVREVFMRLYDYFEDSYFEDSCVDSRHTAATSTFSHRAATDLGVSRNSTQAKHKPLSPGSPSHSHALQTWLE